MIQLAVNRLASYVRDLMIQIVTYFCYTLLKGQLWQFSWSQTDRFSKRTLLNSAARASAAMVLTEFPAKYHVFGTRCFETFEKLYYMS